MKYEIRIQWGSIYYRVQSTVFVYKKPKPTLVAIRLRYQETVALIVKKYFESPTGISRTNTEVQRFLFESGYGKARYFIN